MSRHTAARRPRSAWLELFVLWQLAQLKTAAAGARLIAALWLFVGNVWAGLVAGLQLLHSTARGRRQLLDDDELLAAALGAAALAVVLAILRGAALFGGQ